MNVGARKLPFSEAPSFLTSRILERSNTSSPRHVLESWFPVYFSRSRIIHLRRRVRRGFARVSAFRAKTES